MKVSPNNFLFYIYPLKNFLKKKDTLYIVLGFGILFGMLVGISDSINSYTNLEVKQILDSNTVDIKFQMLNNEDPNFFNDSLDFLSQYPIIEDIYQTQAGILDRNFTIDGKNQTNLAVYGISENFLNISRFNKYYEVISFSDVELTNGIIISEQLAKNQNLKINDSMTMDFGNSSYNITREYNVEAIISLNYCASRLFYYGPFSEYDGISIGNPFSYSSPFQEEDVIIISNIGLADDLINIGSENGIDSHTIEMFINHNIPIEKTNEYKAELRDFSKEIQDYCDLQQTILNENILVWNYVLNFYDFLDENIVGYQIKLWLGYLPAFIFTLFFLFYCYKQYYNSNEPMFDLLSKKGIKQSKQYKILLLESFMISIFSFLFSLIVSKFTFYLIMSFIFKNSLVFIQIFSIPFQVNLLIWIFVIILILNISIYTYVYNQKIDEQNNGRKIQRKKLFQWIVLTIITLGPYLYFLFSISSLFNFDSSLNELFYYIFVYLFSISFILLIYFLSKFGIKLLIVLMRKVSKETKNEYFYFFYKILKKKKKSIQLIIFIFALTLSFSIIPNNYRNNFERSVDNHIFQSFGGEFTYESRFSHYDLNFSESIYDYCIQNSIECSEIISETIYLSTNNDSIIDPKGISKIISFNPQEYITLINGNNNAFDNVAIDKEVFDVNIEFLKNLGNNSIYINEFTRDTFSLNIGDSIYATYPNQIKKPYLISGIITTPLPGITKVKSSQVFIAKNISRIQFDDESMSINKFIFNLGNSTMSRNDFEENFNNFFHVELNNVEEIREIIQSNLNKPYLSFNSNYAIMKLLNIEVILLIITSLCSIAFFIINRIQNNKVSISLYKIKGFQDKQLYHFLLFLSILLILVANIISLVNILYVFLKILADSMSFQNFDKTIYIQGFKIDLMNLVINNLLISLIFLSFLMGFFYYRYNKFSNKKISNVLKND